jgi:predicted RNA-binding Zn ribbon-like protein
MPLSPVQERFAPDAPFRFVGGDPSLDFVNTADWTPRGLERDRFTDFERVVEWARGAGVVSIGDGRRLTQTATRHPRQATAAFESVRVAREVVREVYSSLITGRSSSSALDQLNELVASAAVHGRLLRDGSRRLLRGWDGLGDSPESVLWPVVWSASELLTSDDIVKLRMCAGDDCGWMYVDRSRNGLRRWCEMSVCGTAEKNRRRATR